MSRLEPIVDGEHAVIRTKTAKGMMVSVARVKSPSSITIPFSEFEACRNVTYLYDNTTPGTMSTYLTSVDERNRKTLSLILSRLFKNEERLEIPLTVYTPLVTGLFTHKSADVSAGLPKPSLDDLMDPIDATC